MAKKKKPNKTKQVQAETKAGSGELEIHELDQVAGGARVPGVATPSDGGIGNVGLGYGGTGLGYGGKLGVIVPGSDGGG